VTDEISPAPRAKGRPSLQQASEIDQAIRDAAVAVLLEHGEAATLNAVAHAAGLSRKTVYARYPGKQELFVKVIRDMMVGAQGVEIASTGSAVDQLHHYIRTALEVVSQPEARAIQRLLAVNPALIAALKDEMLGATIRLFYVPLHALLHEADRRGELIVGDAETTARVLIKVIFAEALRPDDGGGAALSPAQRADYAQTLTTLFSRGLLPR
jgi:AcrR family transcriptional regulator